MEDILAAAGPRDAYTDAALLYLNDPKMRPPLVRVLLPSPTSGGYNWETQDEVFSCMREQHNPRSILTWSGTGFRQARMEDVATGLLQISKKLIQQEPVVSRDKYALVNFDRFLFRVVPVVIPHNPCVERTP